MWQGVAWHGKMWQDEYVNRPKAGLCPAFGLLLVAEAEEATDNFEEYPEAEPDPLLIAVGWALALSRFQARWPSRPGDACPMSI